MTNAEDTSLVEKYRSVSNQRENEAAHASVQLKLQSTSRNKECKPCSQPWGLIITENNNFEKDLKAREYWTEESDKESVMPGVFIVTQT